MLRPIVFPYKLGSKSAKELSRALNTKRVRANGRYRPFRNHVVINWGNSTVPTWRHPTLGSNPNLFLNSVQSVGRASNKLSTLRILQERSVPCVEFTTSPHVGREWLTSGQKVYARTLLNACSGRGIVICNSITGLVDAPLWTKHFKHKREYRVHVFQGRVIDVQLKRKRRGMEINHEIRNLAGGWVYTRENIETPDVVNTVGINAVSALGLDFGAVDVAYNLYHGDARVLEVNTAPGLEGSTLYNYVNAIRGVL